MKTVVKLRWLILALWLVAAALLAMTAPNMETLVREKGQIKVPDGYSSSQAATLISEMNQDKPRGAHEESAVLVFHDDKGIDQSDLDEMKRGIDQLKQGEAEYGITSVITHFDTKELEKQMVSQDGKTVLVLVNVDMSGKTPAEARDSTLR